jgi:peptidoglycan/LPS O-acetylase OafA/YrhL
MVQPGALGPKTINMTADFGYLRCLAGFLLGMLTYEWYRSQWGGRLLKRDWVFIVFFGLTLAGMHFNWHELVVVAFFPLVILSAASNTNFVKRVLETKPLQRLGDWSFSIYLVHVLLIQSVWLFWLTGKPDLLKDFGTFFTHTHSHTPGQAWLICLGLVSVTLLISALSYRFVEVPLRNYLNRRFTAELVKTVAG